MKVLIAAGGSGGHIFPAVALARTLKRKAPEADILFIGSNKALDKRIFKREGFRFSLFTANKLPYRISFGIVLFLLKLSFDCIKAVFIIALYRPDRVVGFGGYCSFPAVLAAYLAGIPKIVHEQNVAPGRANKFLFNMADTIALSFNETLDFLGEAEAKKAVFTGNPIRRDILREDRSQTAKSLGLDGSLFTILVIGGSQGAHFLNEVFVKAISGLDENVRASLQIMHITGMDDYEWAVDTYADLGVARRVWSFIDRIEEAYSASDLVITRAGASAIFELAFFGKPMILIPYPFAMSHQAENARVFSGKGAAIEIDERSLTPDLFRSTLLDLFNNRARLSALAESAKALSVPEASENLAKRVLCP